MERIKGHIMKHFACCAKEENSIFILNGEVKAKMMSSVSLRFRGKWDMFAIHLEKE